MKSKTRLNVSGHEDSLLWWMIKWKRASGLQKFSKKLELIQQWLALYHSLVVWHTPKRFDTDNYTSTSHDIQYDLFINELQLSTVHTFFTFYINSFTKSYPMLKTMAAPSALWQWQNVLQNVPNILYLIPYSLTYLGQHSQIFTRICFGILEIIASNL